MTRGIFKILAVAAAVALASCGQGEQAAVQPSEPAAATIEPDESPKNIGALSADWQNAGDAILDDTRVRDVTFALDDRGATVEVIVRALDDELVAQLVNNEGQVVAETRIAAEQEGRLTGQATGGNRNLIRLVRQIPRSAPAYFSMRIRTIPEAN